MTRVVLLEVCEEVSGVVVTERTYVRRTKIWVCFEVVSILACTLNEAEYVRGESFQ
jgi:hypothetical protein